MKKTRYFLYILLSLSSLVLMGSLIQNLWFQKKDWEQEVLSLGKADMQLGTVHFTEIKDGVKKWELLADDVQYFKDKELMRLKGVRISYFSESSEPIVIKGKEGHFNSDSGDIEVFGDVVVTSTVGETLFTDFLRYNADEELITTDAEIILQGAQATIKGKGLSMDVKNNKFIVLDKVSARFHENPFSS